MSSKLLHGNSISTLVIVLVVIFAFLFYWYEVRPFQARSSCANKVITQGLYATSNIEKEKLNGDMNKINAYEREKSRFAYEECLHENGLAK
jgi:hypothetical protein